MLSRGLGWLSQYLDNFAKLWDRYFSAEFAIPVLGGAPLGVAGLWEQEERIFRGPVTLSP